METKDNEKSLEDLVNELGEYYNEGCIGDIDAEFVDLLEDKGEPVILGSLDMFMTMWLNSEHRDDLERLFELMTGWTFDEFVKHWIKEAEAYKNGKK